jgi:hypothetical protein
LCKPKISWWIKFNDCTFITNYCSNILNRARQSGYLNDLLKDLVKGDTLPRLQGLRKVRIKPA